MIDLREMAVKVTSQFGYRKDPFTGETKYHSGTDMVLKDDRIPSIGSGTVAEVGKTAVLGNYVKIRHNDGTLATYGHLNSPSNLLEGTAINEGDLIGIQGSTGRSTGKHLHLTIRDANNELVDPEEYMEGGGGFSVSTLSTDRAADDLSLLGKVISFLSIVALVVLAFVFFMKAFDIKLM